MLFKGKASELLKLESLHAGNIHILQGAIPSGLNILWLMSKRSHLKVDGVEYSFVANQIVCFTEFHKIEVLELEEARLIRLKEEH